MSFLAWGDVPTWGLFAGAVVTAVFAVRAFGKQSEDVSTLRRHAQDLQEQARGQGELLKVQSDQLGLQRQQLDEQRAVIARQTDVLELQAKELKASIEQRDRETAERRRAQAVRVFMWEDRRDDDPVLDQEDVAAGGRLIIARVRNASGQPVYDLMLSWHRGSAPWGTGDMLRPLMPGEEACAKRALPDDLPEHADLLGFGAVAFFRDAAGIRWRARPDGELDEIPPGQEPPPS